MNKNFYLLMGSRVFSNIGDSLFYVFMMWYIYNNFTSEIWLGLAGVMFTLPSIFGFLFGPIIDRYSPKKTYILISIMQLLIILILIIYQYMSVPTAPIILLFILAMSITTEISYPLESVIIPRVVKKKSMYKANSLMSISDNTIDMFANGLSGIMIASFSLMIILNINMILFLLPVLLMMMLNIIYTDENEETVDYSYRGSLKEGFLFTMKRKILNLVLPLIIINFTFSMVLVALPEFSNKLAGPETYGLMLMAFGIGSIIGASIVNKVMYFFSFKYLTIFCFLFSGISWLFMVFFTQNSIYLTFMLITVSYIFVGMINVMYTTLFQVIPSEKLIGRVNTIVESMISSVMPIGSLVAGLLLVKYNVESIISTFGFSLLLMSFVYLFIINKNDYDDFMKKQ